MEIKPVEHIAIAVDPMQRSLRPIRDTCGPGLEHEDRIVPNKLAMLSFGQSYIEPLEAHGPDSGVAKWIAEKGTILFPICFEIDDIEGAFADLKIKAEFKVKNVKLQGDRRRIGHGGSKIIFPARSVMGH